MIFLGLGKPKSGHWTQLCSLRSTTFGDFPKGDPNQQTEKVHGKRPMFFSKFYPVNIQKTMENHHVWWGKSPIKSINEPWLPVRAHRPPPIWQRPSRCQRAVQLLCSHRVTKSSAFWRQFQPSLETVGLWHWYKVVPPNYVCTNLANELGHHLVWHWYDIDKPVVSWWFQSHCWLEQHWLYHIISLQGGTPPVMWRLVYKP